jgi:hypothetical protein
MARTDGMVGSKRHRDGATRAVLMWPVILAVITVHDE